MGFDVAPDGSPAVVEVVFRLSDEDYPFVRISDREGCEVELLRMLPRGDGEYAEFYAVKGADPEAVHRHTAQAEFVQARLLAQQNSHALFEFEVSGRSPASDLATLKAIPVTVKSEAGTGRIEAEIVPPPDPASVIEAFQQRYPDATLVEKTEKQGAVPLFTERQLAVTLESRLTDRQLEVLRTAFEAGYYERPREATGADLAERLDISVATFSQHVRVAEKQLLTILFEQDVL